MSIKTFLSPLDPSLSGSLTFQGWDGNYYAFGNYAQNSAVFTTPDVTWNAHLTMASGFPDGTSNTVLFGEQYSHCGQVDSTAPWPGVSGPPNYLSAYKGWAWPIVSDGDESGAPYFDGSSLCNFASAGVPSASTVAVTPQFMPTVANCVPWNLQAMTAGGTVVGLADGSVRIVSPSISGTTWARAMYPNDGLVLGSDW